MRFLPNSWVIFYLASQLIFYLSDLTPLYIQEELDRIVALGWDLGSIKASGYGVFLESIKYRYYPIFMLFREFA